MKLKGGELAKLRWFFKEVKTKPKGVKDLIAHTYSQARFRTIYYPSRHECGGGGRRRRIQREHGR